MLTVLLLQNIIASKYPIVQLLPFFPLPKWAYHTLSIVHWDMAWFGSAWHFPQTAFLLMVPTMFSDRSCIEKVYGFLYKTTSIVAFSPPWKLQVGFQHVSCTKNKFGASHFEDWMRGSDLRLAKHPAPRADRTHPGGSGMLSARFSNKIAAPKG